MSSPETKSQKDLILEYMEKNGSITPLEAQRYIGCMRLGARIWDLRRDGYDIIRELVSVPTRNGGHTLIAKYRLEA